MTKQTIVFFATAFLLASTLAASWWSDDRKVDQLALPLAQVPQNLHGWRSMGDMALPDATEAVLRATSYLQRGYHRNTDALELFIAYYAVQRPGESLHSPKNCLPGSGWELWDYTEVPIQTANGPVKVNRYSIRNGMTQKQVLYWYQAGDKVIAGEYGAKLDLIWRSLTTGHTAAAIVRLVADDNNEARKNAEMFASDIIPEVSRAFGK